jgi:hypothetical protein
MNNPKTIDIDSYITNSEKSKINIKIINNKINNKIINNKINNKIINNKIKKKIIIWNNPIINTRQIILSNAEFDIIYNDNYNYEDPINLY